MSTSTEITRLIAARNKIRDKMIELGLGVSTDKLDVLANEVENITYRGAISATVQEGDTYTIPAGYHNGSGTVSGVAGGGNYTLQAKGPITPTKQQQNITADNGYYGLSGVTVGAIPEAYQNVSSVTAASGDVLSGKIIVSSDGSILTGTMPNIGAVSKSLDATSGNQSYTVPAGYHNGNGTVSITLEEKTATPSVALQSITPTNGKVLSKVTVASIPSAYQNVTGVTAVASHVVASDVFVDSTGAQVTGTMATLSSAVVYWDDWSENSTFSDDNYKAYQYQLPVGFNSTSKFFVLNAGIKSVTPATTSQVITADSVQLADVLEKVTVNAIPSKYGDISTDTAKASHLLYGYKAHTKNSSGNAIQITGTMNDMSGYAADFLDFEALDEDSTAVTYVWAMPTGYYGNSTATIVATVKSATPSTASQTIQAAGTSADSLLQKVIVNPIPSIFGDTNTDTAVASQLLYGYKAHTKSGGAAVQITGTMANNGAISASIDGLTTLSYAVPTGYTSGGTVSLTSDIENALAAI